MIFRKFFSGQSANFIRLKPFQNIKKFGCYAKNKRSARRRSGLKLFPIKFVGQILDSGIERNAVTLTPQCVAAANVVFRKAVKTGVSSKVDQSRAGQTVRVNSGYSLLMAKCVFDEKSSIAVAVLYAAEKSKRRDIAERKITHRAGKLKRQIASRL